MLRRTGADPTATALALNVAALMMFILSAATTLMTVSTAGIYHTASLISGPEGLRSHGLAELGAVVLFTTMAAPLAKLLCMLYVLGGLRMQTPPRHLQTVFAWVSHLRPWSMIEVYLLGVAVAYVKLSDLVHISLGPAIFSLCALMVTMVAADSALDPAAVWERLDRGPATRKAAPTAFPSPLTPSSSPAGRNAGAMAPVGCRTCGLVCMAPPHGGGACPRCGSHVHRREPNSISRTWALSLAALILYVPANYYPVLTVVQMGSGSPSTILGGVVELVDSKMYPLAALVFFASVAVPVLKLIGLVYLLIAAQMHSRTGLRERTKLYRVVAAVGRWSMIDIFMESILVALVQFGSAVTIDPGVGAVAFAGVVIITMFAAEGFDPRLMWDKAGANPEPAP
jgi:paraquat-inducible protein A